MKRLFLLRHAKAGFGTSDQIRPLSSRGRNDASWLGQYLKNSEVLPDHILCSSATRAVETQSQLLEGIETDIPTSFHDDLYLASGQHIAHQLQLLAPNINAPMIIAHNPGLAMLFQDLVCIAPNDDRSLKYPTCMVTVMDFDIDVWSELRSNTGQLFKMIVPSDEQKNYQ